MSAATSRTAWRSGSKAKATRQTPPSAVKRSFLHVGVPRPLEGVGSPAAQRRPERLEELRVREQFVLHFGRQGVELGIEVRMEDDFPGHAANMTPDTYAVKGMPADVVPTARRAAVPRTQPPTCTPRDLRCATARRRPRGPGIAVSALSAARRPLVPACTWALPRWPRFLLLQHRVDRRPDPEALSQPRRQRRAPRTPPVR